MTYNNILDDIKSVLNSEFDILNDSDAIYKIYHKEPSKLLIISY